eukprot:gene16532-7955_t
MSQDYWFRQVDLVEKLLHHIKISHKETHVGIIDFSDHVHDRVKLVDGYQGDVIFQRLEKLRLEYEGGSHTYTDQALLDAANLFKHSPLSRNALSVLVMLTDGKMTLSDHFIGESKVRERVSELKALGVKIFCITFGDTLYIEGLHAIVGAHNTEFIYQSESFNVSHFIQRLQLVLPKQEYEPVADKQCNETYLPIGCFYDHQVSPRPMPDLILTDRDPNHANFSGTEMDLSNWNTYIKDVVCRCARRARSLNLPLFSIQFYGECHGKRVEHGFAKDGPALSPRACLGADFKSCGNSLDSGAMCVGKQFHNFVYMLKSA